MACIDPFPALQFIHRKIQPVRLYWHLMLITLRFTSLTGNLLRSGSTGSRIFALSLRASQSIPEPYQHNADCNRLSHGVPRLSPIRLKSKNSFQPVAGLAAPRHQISLALLRRARPLVDSARHISVLPVPAGLADAAMETAPVWGYCEFRL